MFRLNGIEFVKNTIILEDHINAIRQLATSSIKLKEDSVYTITTLRKQLKKLKKHRKKQQFGKNINLTITPETVECAETVETVECATTGYTDDTLYIETPVNEDMYKDLIAQRGFFTTCDQEDITTESDGSEHSDH